MTDNPRALITKDNLILAGTKVRDKSGGPSMVIVGFSDHPNFVHNEKLNSKVYLYQKVFVNINNKTFEELNENLNGEDSVFTYFFFVDLFEEVKISDFRPACSNILYITCKYWSEKDSEYKYVNKIFPELEVIS